MPTGCSLDLVKPFEDFVRKHLDEDHPRRLHLSHKPIKKFITPKKTRAMGDMKPTGLWYGINDAWIEWCTSEEPHWLQPKVYEIILDEDKILKIGSLAEFDDFNEQYKETPHYLRGMPSLSLPSHFNDHINWEAVAEKFGGVEISPYLWQRRLNVIWYYPWDCASGVVWGKKAVKEIRLFAEFDEEKAKFVKITKFRSIDD